MKKLVSALLVSAALGSVAPAMAAGFGHQQDLTLNNKDLKVTETSARILGNAAGNGFLLVDDVTDGFGTQKVPGYKMMVMSRASSVAHDGRQGPDGKWRDNRAIHRGSKVTFGIPVINGKPDVNKAILLDMAVISDLDVPDTFKADDKIRPRGKQLLKKETKVEKPELKIERMSLPDLSTGETTGGGIQFTASVILDGQKVATKVNSTFQGFDVTKPDMLRPFETDARFFKK